jgi:hypothetical protein
MPAREPERLPSLARFFDRLVRRSLADLGLGGEAVADYLTVLLCRFARTEQLYAIRDAAGRPLDSVVALLGEAERTWAFDAPDFDPYRERAVRQHIGDYALFMTGLFREHVEQRAGLGLYLREGPRAYRVVADFERAALGPQARLFTALAARFESYAGALGYMRRVHLRPAEAPPGLGPALRLLTGW